MEIKTIDEKSVTAYKRKITIAEQEASVLVVASPEDEVKAADLRVRLKQAERFLTTEKKKATDPLNTALKTIRSWFDPMETAIANAVAETDRKTREYRAAVQRKAAEEAAKLEKRVEKGTLRPETAMRKMETLPQTQATVEGARGKVTYRKVPKVRIINEASIPREYLVPDMVAIRRDALAGKEIAGVEVYEDEIASS